MWSASFSLSPCVAYSNFEDDNLSSSLVTTGGELTGTFDLLVATLNNQFGQLAD